jgi:hypothetical protein
VWDGVSRRVCEEPEQEGAGARTGQGPDEASRGDMKGNDHPVKNCSLPFV